MAWCGPLCWLRFAVELARRRFQTPLTLKGSRTHQGFATPPRLRDQDSNLEPTG
jgi:hypothetical protein